MYNYTFNTIFNIKNNTQYQFEPIFWKINSILNDSVLSIYVLTIIYTYMLYNYRRKTIVLTAVIIIYFYVNTYKNQFIFSNIIKLISYNTTLFNGLLLIHPIYLYISYGAILYIFNFYKTPLTVYQYITTIVSKKFFFVLNSVIALSLGCWWAQQEISWGGWWNWDPIEMIAFMIFIISLSVAHVKFNTNVYTFSIKILVFLFFINTYFVSRYDVLNSIHSFALSSKSQQYLELKVIVLYILYLHFFKNLHRRFYLGNMFWTFSVIVLIFIAYYLYNLFNIFKNITFNSIFLLNLSNQNEKNIYVFLIMTLITLLARVTLIKKNLTTGIICFICLILDAYVVAIIYLLLVFYSDIQLKIKNNINRQKSLYFHTIIFILLVILLLYSNIEIFFSNKSSELFLHKYVAHVTTQINRISLSTHIEMCIQTRTRAESFLVGNSNFIKLLYQNIGTNIWFNSNKIELSKFVYFIQNYLCLYLFIWGVVYIIMYFTKSKSGIV